VSGDRIERTTRIGFAIAAAIAAVIVAVALVTIWASETAVVWKLLGTLGGLAVGAGFLIRLWIVARPDGARPRLPWRRGDSR
jgi:hypothetical protein